ALCSAAERGRGGANPSLRSSARPSRRHASARPQVLQPRFHRVTAVPRRRAGAKRGGVLKFIGVLLIGVTALGAAAIGTVRLLAVGATAHTQVYATPALALGAPPERARLVAGAQQHAIIAGLQLPQPRIAQPLLATTRQPETQ